MEFIHAENDPSLPVEELRVNWYYRPRDIQRKATDSRVVFASMHSDTSALSSLRGKCYIKHRTEVTVDECRKLQDTFWFDKMYDRYIHRYYEVVPTNNIINVPPNVKKVLDERWKYVLVEIGRSNLLTDPSKQCQRCGLYCSNSDSVDCAVCKNTYHMNCVQPPLQKKPARGFGWSCGPCSRKQEKRLEARNVPTAGGRSQEGDEEEVIEEEEEEVIEANKSTPGQESKAQTPTPRPATIEQIAFAKMWQFRYLGIHCAVEDALDYDDRIYPRASSRLGPKHQANIHVWHGHPVEYVKPSEIRKKYAKNPSHKKDGKLSKETVAALEAERALKEKRPKWVLDEPPGFVRRGEDRANDDPTNTAKVTFRLPKVGEHSSRGVGESSKCTNRPTDSERLVDDYMGQAKKLAGSVGMTEYSTNFLDKALELFYNNYYKVKPALQQLQNLQKRKDFKEPELSKEELKRFEDGIHKYGSELGRVSRHVGKSQKHGEIVRFYYMWKKTQGGHRIWDNHESRKGKKSSRPLDSRLVDDVADDADDSAFDNEKAGARKRGFECKFCSTRHSTQWRRAPLTAPGATTNTENAGKGSKDKNSQLIVALCSRCANLWRRYGIQYEDIEEVAKKVAGGGGRAWKRKADEELLVELVGANSFSFNGVSNTVASAAALLGVHVTSILPNPPPQEPMKKKQKTAVEAPAAAPAEPAPESAKKKVVEKPPEPPLVPDPPRWRELSCKVCSGVDNSNGPLLCCRHCRLTVHQQCYGDPDREIGPKWTCDQCLNDSSCQISNTYKCVLCPVEDVDSGEMFQPPKASHNKKTDREREKERLEREMVVEATEQYRHEQIARGRPLHPREAVKSTSEDNWVHILCAIFNPEIKFAKAKSLERAEGISSIPTHRWSQICQVCGHDYGVCVNCKQCSVAYHVTCAQMYGHHIGFDIAPVKVSRRDAVNIVTMGEETGHATPVVYCKEHVVKTTIHSLNEVKEGSALNTLQQYCRTYKQADLSLTGTVRKAAMINYITKGSTQSSAQPLSNGHNETPTTTPVQAKPPRRLSVHSTVKLEHVDIGDEVKSEKQSAKTCSSCGVDVSPLWHETKVKSPRKVADGDSHIPQGTSHLTNGLTNGTVIEADTSKTTAEGSEKPSSEVVDHAITNETTDTVPLFYCHKCHLKRLRNPSPVKTPAPETRPVETPITRHDAQPNGVTVPSPPVMPADPRSTRPPAPTMAAREPLPHRTWAYDHQQRYPSDALRSPPTVTAPRASLHYEGPPGPAPYSQPVYSQAPPRLDPRAEVYPQHPINGIPPPYARRDSHGYSAHPAYALPSRRDEPRPMSPVGHRYHHPSPHAVPHQTPLPPPRVTRSPSVHDGPHGIPRAAENPFAAADPSPRDDYGDVYGAPYRSRPRPETPPAIPRRSSGWGPGDGQLNGASASPSVRNLLS